MATDKAQLDCSNYRYLISKLVTEHGGMVFASARRQVCLDRSATEVTCAVFESLASRSASIRRQDVTGYLLLQTYRKAFTVRRAETGIRYFDANALGSLRKDELGVSDTPRGYVSRRIDEALARLSTKYRSVVGMHFIERRSIVDLAQTFAIDADAANNLCRLAVGRLFAFSDCGHLMHLAEFISLIRNFANAEPPQSLLVDILRSLNALTRPSAKV